MGVPTLPQVAESGSHPINTMCFEGSDPRALSCFRLTLGTRLGYFPRLSRSKRRLSPLRGRSEILGWMLESCREVKWQLDCPWRKVATTNSLQPGTLVYILLVHSPPAHCSTTSIKALSRAKLNTNPSLRGGV